MIGNVKWFKPYAWIGGIGIRPSCWQGSVYLLVMGALLFVSSRLPLNPPLLHIIFTALLILGIAEINDITLRIPKDALDTEQITKRAIISQRNAAWFMIGTPTILLIYQIINVALARATSIDWPIVIILFGTVAVKYITYWRLRD